MTWELKEVLGIKKVEGAFDSNQCARKSTGGRSSMRVITNPKCMADELHLRYDDQQAKQQSRDGNVSFPRHGGKKLGSLCNGNGYPQE